MILLSAFLVFSLGAAEINFQDISQRNISNFENGTCSYRENFSLERIREGVNAKTHQWPWFAALKLRTIGKDEYTGTCGATIVSNHFLLTGKSLAHITRTILVILHSINYTV